MKMHTCRLRVDSRKHVEMKRFHYPHYVSYTQASRLCEIKHGVSFEHVHIV